MSVYTNEWARCIREIHGAAKYIHNMLARKRVLDALDDYEAEVRRMLRDRNEEIKRHHELLRQHVLFGKVIKPRTWLTKLLADWAMKRDAEGK